MAGESISVYHYGSGLSIQLWLLMAGYINYISSRYVFYLFINFSDRVRGMKIEQYDVATYGRRIHVFIFFGYEYLSNVSSLDCG